MMKDQFKAGKDFIGVGVFALIQNSEDKFLLAKKLRSEKRDAEYENLWAMSGGEVEFGEKCEKALIREIKEETNLDVEIKKFINFNDYIKNGRHWVALNFLVYSRKDNFKNNEPKKMSEMKWFSIDQIPKNISPFAKKCFADLQYLHL